MNPFSKHIHLKFVLIGLGLFLGACTVMAPAQEMSNARQTLQTAKAVGADIYARDKYSKAKVFLDEAANHLNSGDFYKARVKALQATEEAKQARLVAINQQRK